MAAEYAIEVLSDYIREELPTVVDECLPAISPVYKYIETTSMGVVRDRIGRNWQIEHTYATGLAGLIQSADVRGPAFLDAADYTQNRVLDSSSANLTPFPNAIHAPHSASIQRILTLHKSTGNFSIPVAWIQADSLGASVHSKVTQDIKAVGQLRALTEAQSFFMGSSNALGQLLTYTGTGEASGYFTCTLDQTTGRTAFLRPGMLVDVYANNSGTPNWGSTGGTHHKNDTSTGAPWGTTYVPLIISDIDYTNGTIKVAAVRNTSLASGSITQIAIGDWLVLANCGTTSGREMKTWGLEDWIKSSGTIMGGSGGTEVLDLDTYSQFKSIVAAVNGPLTDSVLNKYVGGFLDAYTGTELDTFITTTGVTMKYLEQPTLSNNRMFYDRTGKALSVMGGWDDVGYSFNGKKFNWITSSMCLAGRLYAIKLGGGNLKKYVPPRIGGTDGRVGTDLEFLAPLGGSSGIFMVARSSTGAAMEVLEAPFWQYCLIAPEEVKGVKLTGLTESTLY